MSTGDQATPTRDELLQRCAALEAAQGRALLAQRDLATAKGRVDDELSRFRVIQHHIEQAVSVSEEGGEAFVELTLETVIEAFELEVAALLRVGETEDVLMVIGSFDGPPEDAKIPFARSRLAAGEARVLRDEPEHEEMLSALGLAQAVACPFFDRRQSFAGLLVAGITKEGTEVYPPITGRVASAFTVMARQTGALWINRQLLREVRAQNVRLQSLTESYSRFVPFQFLRLLARSTIEDVHAGDSVALDLSVLFADIRGFTTLSEELGAQGIFESLNEVLAGIEPLIAAEDGFINQYLGDAIMALFPTSADAALRCAVGIARAMAELSAQRAAEGKPVLPLGLGIHRGPLMLGALGGGRRLDSNVIGDTANLASRVEGLTRIYGSAALTTGELVSQLEEPSDIALREIDLVAVKGRSTPIALWEILDCERPEIMEAKSSVRADFDRATALYRAGDFDAASNAFAACARTAPMDEVSVLLRDRCRELNRHRPEDEWNGVWRWDRK